MKQFITYSLTLFAFTVLAQVSSAEEKQKEEGKDQPKVKVRRFDAQRGEGNREGKRGPGRGFTMRRYVPPMMKALDTNKDGELSSEEIENATTALKSLDKNKDGKLSREELRPSFGGRGQGFGGANVQRISFADRMMQLDKNKDGKISGDEIPERMKKFLERIDENKDGAIDKAEIEKMAERMKQSRGAAGRPVKRNDEQKKNTKPDDDI